VIPIAIYPYCAELLPIIRHFDTLQTGYKLQRLISPPGLSLTGHDAAYVCSQPDTGYTVTELDGEGDMTWETLFVFKPLYEPSISDELLYEAAAWAVEADKGVIFFANTVSDIPAGVMELARRKPAQVKLHSYDVKFTKTVNSNTQLNQIEKPIILVGGLLEQPGVTETLLNIYKGLVLDGLSPLVFAKQPVTNIFGFHNISHVMEDKQKSNSEKTIYINTLIRSLECKTAPDVILIEAPDALMRFNDFDPNGFGIGSFMLCQAARPDYIVCDIPFELAYGPLMEAYSKDFEYRLGNAITAAIMGNYIVDSAELQQTNKISVVYADREAIEEQQKQYAKHSAVPVFSPYDGQSGLYSYLRKAITGDSNI